MSTKHYTERWKFGGKHSWEIYVEGTGIAVCSMAVKESPWRDLEIDQARGHMIAAAPDLLAACRVVVANWERGDLAAAVRQCAKAIQTAEGEGK